MIQIAEAIKQGGIIKDMLDSPEFKAAVAGVKSLNSESTADQKVDAINNLIPFLLPIGEFGKTLLGKKGDATIDEITEILTAIHDK